MKRSIVNSLVITLTLLALAFSALGVTPAQAKPRLAPGDFLRTWGGFGTGDGQFVYPFGVAADSNGNVYVADTYNHRIQKFNSSGTFVAQWGASGTGDGQFLYPYTVAVDSGGNIYVGDSANHRIQKFNSNGTFLAKWGTRGSEDGQFYNPIGVVVDSAGNVYVADADNHRIQKFTNSGTFLAKWGTQGSEDGQFEKPFGVAVDSVGNVYVADRNNHRMQKFTSSGTFVAQWGAYGTGDGQFALPFGVAVDSGGNVYVGDSLNNRIQKFNSSGTFLAKWGTQGSEGGQFMSLTSVAVDSAGNVYVADTSNHRIQVFEGGANTYTVSFDAQGGTPTPASMVVTYDSPYGALPVVSRVGYIFDGWYTAPTGGTLVTEATDVTIASDHTLYAQWTASTQTVSFDAQGGTPTPDSMVVTYGNPYGALPVVSRAGYIFNGWYTAPTGGTLVTEATVVTATSDHTLYAQWTASTYTVSFDAQGGTPTPDSMVVTYDSPYGALPVVSRVGYIFDGWYTAPTGGTLVTEATVVTATSDHTLYAQWTASTQTVSFDAQGGTPTPDSMVVTYGNPYGALPVVSRAGYIFNGWYTAPTGGTLVTESTVVTTASDHTLYAQWLTGISSTWVGGVAIQSDQPIVTVGRPHLGAEVTSYIGSASGGLTQYVPMLFKGAFGGGYNAALYIQNISGETASLVMEFTNSNAEIVYIKTDTLAPNSSKGYWLPSEAGLPSGFVGGVKVISNRPILTVGRPHINGQVMTYNGAGLGSTTAWLPMFFKDGFGSYNTALYIQNVTDNAGQLLIEYINLDGTVACTYSDLIGAQASKGYWSLSAVCDTGSLPSGFVGGVKVTSTENILTVARAHLGTQITTYNGFAGGTTSAYAPMLFRKAFAGGSYNAALYLQNVSGVSANVTIEYVDNAGVVAITQDIPLAAGAISSIWLPGVAGLPDGFVGGARISATQNIIAVGRPHLGTEITAYNGAPLGSTSAYLPMLFKNAFAAPYNAAFYIQNVTGNTATVDISFYDDAGTLSCIKTISLAPNATQGFWMPSVSCAP